MLLFCLRLIHMDASVNTVMVDARISARVHTCARVHVLSCARVFVCHIGATGGRRLVCASAADLDY